MTASTVDGRTEVLRILSKELTNIAWSDITKNYWHGCSKVDTECRLCYAETQTKRYGRDIWGATKDRWFMSEANNLKPYRWEKLAAEHDTFLRIFCGSMFDWAEIHKDPEISDRMNHVRHDVLYPTIEATPHLIWQLLTKRPENIVKVVPERWLTDGFPANVHIGTSVGYQGSAEKRIPELLSVPGNPTVRFLSVEPMVGPVDLSRWVNDRGTGGIGWVLVGGESGPLDTARILPVSQRARRMDLDWLIDLMVQTKGIVPLFVKQTGTVLAKEMGLKHPKGENPAEWPAWMQVQEFPELAS